MNTIVIKPYNLVDETVLPEITVDQELINGDPLEIKGEIYYVCNLPLNTNPDPSITAVIPLIVKNPARIKNITEYLQCLSLAHRRVLFKNANGSCDLENCDEMIIM